jgi:two-component system KDP operon response regulator KdpE
MATILLVDDDQSLLRALRIGLSARGYEVATARSGNEGLTQVSLATPDVVVLDLGLPDLDGIEVCRRIRQWSAVPIIVLSAAGAEGRKVAALDAGADDYVTKPFNMNELMARVRAALRRIGQETSANGSDPVSAGDIQIDLLTRRVTVRGGEVHMTPKEFDLLLHLMRNPGRVLTHRALLAAVWGAGSTQQPEYLHVFMNHLRKKLEPEDGSVRYIVTEKWVGYRFEPTPQD